MIFDIDGTLFGDEESLEQLKKIIISLHETIGFGVATGRTIDSAKEVLLENNLVLPDFIISSVGSEIYYRSNNGYVYGTGWDAHISNQWKRNDIVKLLSRLDFLKCQDESVQRKFKLSYYIDLEKGDIDSVRRILIDNKIKANLILSHGSLLDILPARASKGRAIRYLSYRWNIPYESILVAGDSGNDEDMLTGEMLGVVVGNHAEELEKLRGRRKIYFSGKNFAAGIIDGIYYYDFLGEGPSNA